MEDGCALFHSYNSDFEMKMILETEAVGIMLVGKYLVSWNRSLACHDDGKLYVTCASTAIRKVFLALKGARGKVHSLNE